MTWAPSKGDLVRLKARRKGEVGRILDPHVEPKPGWVRALVSWRDDFGYPSGDQFVDVDKLEPVPATEIKETPMRITACSVRDFKRIREINLNLTDEERVWVLIGGNNAQGKSSLLDALAAALGGGRRIPPDPVRHGADKAEIRVEIDGGALLVRRVIKPDGKTELVVTHDGVPVRSPQALLDGMVGQFLDPLAFLALGAADQRAALLAAIDGDGQIAALEGKRAAAYQRRRDTGRDLKKAEGELERLPEVTPVAQVDAAALAQALTEAMEEGNRVEAAQRDLERARNEYKAAEADITRLTAELKMAQERKAAATAAGNAAAKIRKELPAADVIAAKVAAAREALSGASQHNAKVAADVAAAERRARAKADVERERAAVTELTAEIERLEAAKDAAIKAAKLPVDGLGFDDTGITLGGVPLEQASSAERLRFALAFAISCGAKLGDVMIRDGALLDDHSLELVYQQAEAAGVRLWIERVGTRDDATIVIQDGGVR